MLGAYESGLLVKDSLHTLLHHQTSESTLQVLCEEHLLIVTLIPQILVLTELLLHTVQVVKLLVLRVEILSLKVSLCDEVIWQHDLTFVTRKEFSMLEACFPKRVLLAVQHHKGGENTVQVHSQGESHVDIPLLQLFNLLELLLWDVWVEDLDLKV